MIAFANKSSKPGWPVVETRPAAYITVAEAVRRALNSEHYAGSENPETVRWWCRDIARRAVDFDRPAVMYDGSLLILPAIHPAFSEPANPVSVSEAFGQLPESRRCRALAKRRVVNDLDAFLNQREARLRGGAFAYTNEGQRTVLKLSARSLRRWRSQHRDGGLEALAKDGRGGGSDRAKSPEAIELYWSMRNDPRRFAIAHIYRVVRHEADERGWEFFENGNTCEKWDRETRDKRSLILNREGLGTYTAKAEPYLESDLESFAPGETWEGDNCTINVWLRLRNGKIVRPVFTCWLDWRSRAIVGYRLVVTGNSESILCAMRQGATRYGLPKLAIVDNGKDFKCILGLAAFATIGRPDCRLASTGSPALPRAARWRRCGSTWTGHLRGCGSS